MPNCAVHDFASPNVRYFLSLFSICACPSVRYSTTRLKWKTNWMLVVLKSIHVIYRIGNISQGLKSLCQHSNQHNILHTSFKSAFPVGNSLLQHLLFLGSNISLAKRLRGKKINPFHRRNVATKDVTTTQLIFSCIVRARAFGISRRVMNKSKYCASKS